MLSTQAHHPYLLPRFYHSLGVQEKRKIAAAISDGIQGLHSSIHLVPPHLVAHMALDGSDSGSTGWRLSKCQSVLTDYRIRTRSSINMY